MIALLVALLQACPGTVPAGADYVALPAGCTAPVAGVLFAEPAFGALRARLADADARTAAEARLKAQARAERDRCRVEGAERVRSLRVALEQAAADLRAAGARLAAAARELLRCTAPPRRTTWAALGAGAGVLVCAGGVAAGALLR